MANRNWASGGKIYSMHTMPILLDCNFVVDSTNGNGLGIRSLKGPAVKAVYMHTTAPLAGSGNPNPAAGTIVVQMADNYNRSFSGFDAIVSPLSGTPLTAVTAGVPVVIVALGTATAAQWQAVGLPIGIMPALGVAFVPTSSATIGGAAAVEIAAAAGSGVMSIETLGDPNQSIAPNPNANQGFGAQFILQCRAVSGAITAPADGSVISLAFYLSNSSVMVQGE
jgi:hypothetical protein